VEGTADRDLHDRIALTNPLTDLPTAFDDGGRPCGVI
jgi:hypothetical protein